MHEKTFQLRILMYKSYVLHKTSMYIYLIPCCCCASLLLLFVNTTIPNKAANTKTDAPITIPEIAPTFVFFSGTPFLTVGVKSGNVRFQGCLTEISQCDAILIYVK